MSLISKEDIAELQLGNQENCISIFIPTHRAGEKVLQEVDSLALKNELKHIKSKLSQQGLHNDNIDKFCVWRNN